MADVSPARGRWAFRPIPPQPRSIVELIGSGTLDSELAAQLWLLIEARVPIVVAAEDQGVGKSTTPQRAARLPAARRPGRGAGRRGRDLRLAPAGVRAGLAGDGAARPPTPIRSVRTRRSCSPTSFRPHCRPTPGARRRGSRSGRRRSATASPRPSMPIRSTTSSTPFAGRRSASPTTSCRISASSSSCADSMTAGGGSSPRTTSGPSLAMSTATSSGSVRRSSRPGTRRRTPSSISGGA